MVAVLVCNDEIGCVAGIELVDLILAGKDRYVPFKKIDEYVSVVRTFGTTCGVGLRSAGLV